MTNSNGKIKIRRMVDADLRRVNEIDSLLFGEKRVRTWPFSFQTYWNIYGSGGTFVAELDGNLAGFLAGNIAEKERSQSILDLMYTIGRSHRVEKIGWIDMIGVLPASQGKHVGQALVEAFYQECKRNGAPLRGIVKEGDEQLGNFLIKQGFRKWETATYEKE
ncbi:GNAT family N-acetyltransferase [Chloroflexota bacterium]